VAQALRLHEAEFLRGTATTDECKPIFEQYEKCLSVSLLTPCTGMTLMGGWQRALNERGIDKMLKEVRDDNRENDADHMKPVGRLRAAQLILAD
jgi:TRIAP1/MDM35 family protein